MRKNIFFYCLAFFVLGMTPSAIAMDTPPKTTDTFIENLDIHGMELLNP